MANPAKDARDKAQAKWPGATVSARARNSITHQHPTEADDFMLDVVVGSMHYGPSEDQEIDTAWQPGTAPWDYEMVKAGYNAFALSDFSSGQVVEYVDPVTGESIAFQPQQLQYTNDLDQIQPIADPQAVNAVVQNEDELFWAGAFGAGFDLRWQAGPGRLDKRLIVDQASRWPTPTAEIIAGGNPVARLQFIFQVSAGIDIFVNGVLWNRQPNNPVDTQGQVEFRQQGSGEVLWAFSIPRNTREESGPDDETVDFTGTFRLRRTGPNLFVEHRIPVDWLQTSTYPIEIDTTIDEDVAHSLDDAWEQTNGAVQNTATTMYCDDQDEIIGFRWAAVAIASGVTVTNATFSAYIGSASWDEPLHSIWGELALTPAQFSATTNDISDRTPTSASVAWDDSGLGATPGDLWSWGAASSGGAGGVDLSSIITELIAQGSWSSGNPMAVLISQVTTSSTRDLAYYGYDRSGGIYPGKLHIEYTAAADLSIGESDGITVGETVTVSHELDLVIDVNDGLIVGETVDPELISFISESDGITLGEAVTVTHELDLTISVSDGLTVGEAVTVAHELDEEISVADGLTIGDTATVDIPIELDRDVSESDGITLGETVTVDPVSLTEISETEALTIGEVATVTHELDLAISVSDDLTVGENAELELISFISEADGITLGETVAVDPVFPHDISESDGLTVGEFVDLELIIFISVSDGLTVGETVTVAPTFPHNISEADGLTVGDSAIVLIPVEGELDVVEFDNIVLGEAVTVDVSDPQIVEADGLTVGEVVDLELILFISETDGLTIGEAVDLEWISFISELDALTVGEAVTVTHELDLEISASDDLTIGETVTLSVTEHNISVSDALTLGETVSVDPLLLDIILSENITLGEAVTLTGIESAELTVGVAESVLVGEVVGISGILGVAGPPWKTKRRERGIEFPEKALLKGIRSQQEQHAEKLRMQAEQDTLQDRRSIAEARVVDRQNDQKDYEAKRQKARQSSLVNLELAAMGREEEAAIQETINKKKRKSLKKARSAKKRKAKQSK